MNKYSLDQVNRLVLHKQHLAEGSKGDDVVQVIKDIFALQAQAPLTPYLSLLTRLRNFDQADLGKALYKTKDLVKIKCMRGTVFILPKEMVVPAMMATQKQFIKSGSLLRLYTTTQRDMVKAKRDPSPFKVTQKGLDKLTKAITNLLRKTRQGLTTEDIKDKLETPINISYLVSDLCDRGILARGEPSHWNTARHKYCLWEYWLPDLKLEMDEATAQAIVISKYLAAYGPVTENDVCWWTGFSKTMVRKALKEMETETEQIKIQGMDDVFIILKSDIGSLQNIRRTASAVRLLPRFDAYLVGYKNRQRMIARAHEEKIFWKTRGEIAASILVNDRIIGSWGYKRERDSLSITFSFFEKVSKTMADKARAEARRLGTLIGDKEIQARDVRINLS